MSTHHEGHGSHTSQGTHAGVDTHAEHTDHDAHGGHEAHGGHGGHHGHGDHVAQFRRLFWIMLVLAVPVVGLSPMFADLLGYSIPNVPGLSWVAPLLGTVMYVWGGRPFLTGGLSEIRSRAPGMMLLISLGITVALLSSWGATLGLLHHELEFWWELALLIVIMLLGHWIEMRSLAQTSSALDSLAALLPDEAERIEGDSLVTVDPADLRTGDLVLVRPGASVPADGTVVEGRADVDESMITGESRAVARTVGDRVVAGTVATDSSLRVEITATGDETALAGIRRLVSDAQSSSSRAQRIADRAAAWLFWFALGAAVLTALVWTLLGMPDDAVIRTVTVLVIACPHALGLAIPLVVSLATERAARSGVLVTDRLALEGMRTVDTVLFDKTGTLTRGEPELSEVAVAESAGIDEQTLLGLAAAAESESEHPLAGAIRDRAAADGATVPTASEITSAPALGVSARVDGHEIRVGGPRLLEETGAAEHEQAPAWREQGAIVLHVLQGGESIGALKLADAVREESREAIGALHDRDIQVVMITGDAQNVAEHVGAELGIDRIFAGVRPEDKADRVAALQEEGRRVAMVGDGVNDALPPGPTSASRSAPAPMSRSARPGWCSPPRTRARSCR